MHRKDCISLQLDMGALAEKQAGRIPGSRRPAFSKVLFLLPETIAQKIGITHQESAFDCSLSIACLGTVSYCENSCAPGSDWVSDRSVSGPLLYRLVLRKAALSKVATGCESPLKQ